MEHHLQLDPILFDDLGPIDASVRLSIAEEGHLARTMEAGLLAQAAPAGQLDEWERGALMARGRYAHERFIIANLRLVSWVITREWADPEPEDLHQEGVVALERAIRGFDHRRGGFAAYAMPFIRQAVWEVRAKRANRSSKWYREWQRVRVAEDTLTQRLARPVQPADLAVHLGESMAWVRERQAPPAPAPVPPSDLVSWLDEAAVDAASTVPVEQIHDLLGRLDPPERRILELHFGLDGGSPRSRRSIARELAMTTKQVVIMEERALETLRRWCPQQLGEYLAA